ncbi:MAG: IS200/IS605 family transposase [Balneolaceae bacterium]|nr:MAG: IS200/IS605 family transposase [Balneolaceae bacterium]
MPQALTKVYTHLVFSTKHRKKLIDKPIETDLYDYLGGICKAMQCNPVQVGGHKDHVHILCLLSRKITQAALLQQVKQGSSKWIKTKGEHYRRFYWQHGYGIFSVNPSQVDVVAKYIRNQEQHHQKMSFQDEFRMFLKKYRVDYDERYVWD